MTIFHIYNRHIFTHLHTRLIFFFTITLAFFIFLSILAVYAICIRKVAYLFQVCSYANDTLWAVIVCSLGIQGARDFLCSIMVKGTKVFQRGTVTKLVLILKKKININSRSRKILKFLLQKSYIVVSMKEINTWFCISWSE